MGCVGFAFTWFLWEYTEFSVTLTNSQAKLTVLLNIATH